MKFIYCFQLFLFCTLVHLNSFATTNVVFSNNSQNNFTLSSQTLDASTNLVQGRDYHVVTNTNVNALVSNVNVLNFNSNDHITNGREYHFAVFIENNEYPGQSLIFYITTQGLLTGSKIVETNLLLPSGEKIKFNPKSFSSLDLPGTDNLVFRFVPYTALQDAVPWPSFVIAIDKKESGIAFDNSQANTFRAMNYNVQLWPIYGDLVNPPNNKMIRAADIPKLIGNGFDSVSLNEVFDKDIRSRVISDMKKNYPYSVDAAGLDSIDFLSSGVVVFSKWPILEHKQHVYSSCYDIECLAAKGITYIKISKIVNGIEQKYNIFSTHMQASNPINEANPRSQPREKQIEELAAFIKAQNIPVSEPVLIAGDLNVNTYETGTENFNGFPQTEYEFLLSTLNASDSIQTGLKYSSDYILNTMLALNSLSQSKIDYVLYLKDHKTPLQSTNEVRALRDTLNPSMYPVYDTSDHFPVIGEFVF